MTEGVEQGVPELTPVREKHRFDETALRTYLQENMEADFSSMKVLQFEGGQSNPTYLIDNGSEQFVVRKKPPGELLKSAHQVDREYKVMTALHETDVPVPKTYLLCEDELVIGTSFYVMENVEGRVLLDTRLPSFSRAERVALYDDFNRVLAALHRVDRASVGLGEFGRAGNYFERQISRWSKQYVASETETNEPMNKLMEWLPANTPELEEVTLVHGDYRIGNCIIHATEPRIVGVLDWELATSGHPFGDLGYCCIGYHRTAPGAGPFGGGDSGIPTEEEFVVRYCELTGRPGIENWNFYIIYNLFRSAAIVQGVYKRGLDGNASSDRWMERDDDARVISTYAWKMVEQGF